MMSNHHISASALSQLLNARYINLTTYRKNGQAIATPVWFAEYDGLIYVETGENYGKIKRVRHTSWVTLAPCSIRGKVLGEILTGEARIVTTTEEIFRAKGAMQRKYGLTRQIYYFAGELIALLRRKPTDNFAYLAISPHLPKG